MLQRKEQKRLRKIQDLRRAHSLNEDQGRTCALRPEAPAGARLARVAGRALWAEGTAGGRKALGKGRPSCLKSSEQGYKMGLKREEAAGHIGSGMRH